MFEQPDAKTQRIFEKSTRQILINLHQWPPKRPPGARKANSSQVMVRTDNIGEVSTCNNFCFDHNRSSFVQVTNQKALHSVDWQEVWTCLDLSDATNEDPPRSPGLERRIQSPYHEMVLETVWAFTGASERMERVEARVPR